MCTCAHSAHLGPLCLCTELTEDAAKGMERGPRVHSQGCFSLMISRAFGDGTSARAVPVALGLRPGAFQWPGIEVCAGVRGGGEGVVQVLLGLSHIDPVSLDSIFCSHLLPFIPMISEPLYPSQAASSCRLLAAVQRSLPTLGSSCWECLFVRPQERTQSTRAQRACMPSPGQP